MLLHVFIILSVSLPKAVSSRLTCCSDVAHDEEFPRMLHPRCRVWTVLNRLTGIGQGIVGS